MARRKRRRQQCRGEQISERAMLLCCSTSELVTELAACPTQPLRAQKTFVDINDRLAIRTPWLDAFNFINCDHDHQLDPLYIPRQLWPEPFPKTPVTDTTSWNDDVACGIRTRAQPLLVTKCVHRPFKTCMFINMNRIPNTTSSVGPRH